MFSLFGVILHPKVLLFLLIDKKVEFFADTADGQDVPWYVEMSRDGNVFAVASWGDEEGAVLLSSSSFLLYTGTVPQIQLFTTDADVTAPFFTQTTPGSMFCLALSQNSDSTANCSATF